MCVSIESEAAARRYTAELLSWATKDLVRNVIKSWQRSRGWLLDYDLKTCTRREVPSTEPGMKAVEAAIREVKLTYCATKTKRRLIDA